LCVISFSAGAQAAFVSTAHTPEDGAFLLNAARAALG
jgi:hypothetical protein